MNAAFENKILYKNRDIQKTMGTLAEETYKMGKFSPEAINGMFNLLPGDLLPEEVEKLGLVAVYTGKRLLNAALNLEKSSYSGIEEIQRALTAHAKNFASFGLHDIAHTLISYELSANSKQKGKINSVVPEFLSAKADNQQVIREELPAFLWTRTPQGGTLFINLMEGRADDLIEQFTTDETDEYKHVADRLCDILRNMDEKDFTSVCIAYTEVCLTITYAVAMEETKKKESSRRRPQGLEN